VRKHPSDGISGRNFRIRGGFGVLRILIVEDDSQLAATLKYLVEDNPRYRVVASWRSSSTIRILSIVPPPKNS
jgi:hypothetical protein